jgi:hypothetical protein
MLLKMTANIIPFMGGISSFPKEIKTQEVRGTNTLNLE